MKRETFFRALSETDDKYVKSAMDRFTDAPGKEIAHKIGKAIYYVAGVAAIIAIVLAIWIPSVIFRDKPIEPAVSDTTAMNDTDPDASSETDPVPETDKPVETDAVTEYETSTPLSIDELVEKLVSLKDIEENWKKLRSYGLTAFDVLTANYHTLYWKSGEEKEIASIYAAEMLRDEIENSEFLRSVTSVLEIPDHSQIGRYLGAADWLANYRNAILTDAAQKSEAEYEELYPLTYRYLKNTGFYSLDEMMQFSFSEYLIKLHYRNDQDVFEYLIRDRAEDTVSYCTEWYFDKSYEYLSDLENRLVCLITTNELKDLCGEKAVRLAFGLPDTEFDILGSVLEKYEEVIKHYIPTAVELAKGAAKDIYASDMEDNYPYVYQMLCAVDFRGYKPVKAEDPDVFAVPDSGTDEEKIDYIINSIVNNGYTDEKWAALMLLGNEKTVSVFQKLYESASSDGRKKTVACTALSELLRTELDGYEKLKTAAGDFAFLKHEDLASGSVSAGNWLYKYITVLEQYLKSTNEIEIIDNAPLHHAVFSKIYEAYRYMVYHPDDHTLEENVKYYLRIKNNGAVFSWLEDRVDQTVDYCVSHYFDEPDLLNRAAMSYVFSEIVYFHEPISDPYLYARSKANGLMTDKQDIDDVPEVAEKMILWWIEAAEVLAADYHREEMNDYLPYSYKLLEAVGFDGYKPGAPDMAFRAKDAVLAAQDLYRIAVLGRVPTQKINASPVQGAHKEYECTERDFYAYFDRYLPSDFVRAYIKGAPNVQFKNGKVTIKLREDEEVAYMLIRKETLKLVEESGSKATVSAVVGCNFEDYFDRAMTFEVYEDKNGVHITGGTFMEKMMPVVELITSGEPLPVSPVSAVVKCFLTVFDGHPVTNVSVYNSYEEMPEWLQKLVDKNIEFPVYFYRKSFIHDGKMLFSDEIYAKLTEKNKYNNGVLFYPDKLPRKVTPAFAFTDGNMNDADILFAVKIIDNSKNHFVCSLDFTVAENGVSTTKPYTFEFTLSEGTPYGEFYVLTGGTFFEELMKPEELNDPKAFMQSVFYAMRFPGQDYTVVYMRDPETYGAPQELVEIANKYFGDRAEYQNYLIYNGISDVSYFKNRAAVCFTEDALRRLYDDNEKMFVNIDGKLYINSDIEQFHDSAFIVTDVSRCEKVKENKYEIDMTLIYTAAAPGPPTWDLTAEVQIISGRPVITGGTFLDFIFEKMLVTK